MPVLSAGFITYNYYFLVSLIRPPGSMPVSNSLLTVCKFTLFVWACNQNSWNLYYICFFIQSIFMSLLINRKIQGDVHLGVWKIEENIEELLSYLNLTPMEQQLFNSLKTEERKKQWLSYRVTIKKLLNLDKILDINYDRYGKPKILNHYLRVSVTHSGEFSAALLHKNKQTGIDIEKIHPRIHKIAHKFLSEEELNELSDKDNTELLHTYWCAKEALFKLHFKRDLSFRENLYIEPFDVSEDIIIKGHINHDAKQKVFTLHQERIEDYMLVYTIDELGQCEE